MMPLDYIKRWLEYLIYVVERGSIAAQLNVMHSVAWYSPTEIHRVRSDHNKQCADTAGVSNLTLYKQHNFTMFTHIMWFLQKK